MLDVSLEEIDSSIEFFLENAKKKSIEMLINRKSINSKVKNESSNKLMKLASGNMINQFNSSFKKINSGYFNKESNKLESKEGLDSTSFSTKLINKKKLVKEEIDEDDFFNN